MSSFIPFLQAATGSAGSASTSSSLIGTLLPFLLIAVIFYFFLLRPQNKKQKETEKMLNALKKGDKVITIGGIHGTVSSVKEKTVIVKVDDDCKLEVLDVTKAPNKQHLLHVKVLSGKLLAILNASWPSFFRNNGIS